MTQHERDKANLSLSRPSAPTPPPNQKPGGLLGRISQQGASGGSAGATAGTQTQPQNQSAGGNNSPFGSRFGQSKSAPPNTNPPAGNNAPAQAGQQRQPPPLGRNAPQRPNNPFANANANNQNNNQRSWTIQPAYKTVVRFDLRGLGDPFYRLMGQDINPDFGDSRALTRALEEGGESVGKLQTLLDEAWTRYAVEGAVLVYNWNSETWKTIAYPEHGQQPVQNDTQSDADDFSDDNNANTQPPKPLFQCLRAIDLALVINVLGRSRSQLLIARAPLLMAQQYLNRSIMSDDPRLVALTRATGFIEEG